MPMALAGLALSVLAGRPQADDVFTATRGGETMAQQWLYGDTFTFSIYDNFGTKEEDFTDKELTLHLKPLMLRLFNLSPIC